MFVRMEYQQSIIRGSRNGRCWLGGMGLRSLKGLSMGTQLKNLSLENMDHWKEKNKHWWIVNLLSEEVIWIKENAAKRNQIGKDKGWVSKTSSFDDSWNTHGLAGEFATSLVLNIPVGSVYSDNIHELRSGDLGGFIEVKTRRENSPNRWDLAVNKDQLKRDRIYVSCISCLFPEYVIVTGWQWGHEIEADSEERVHSGHGHTLLIYPIEKTKDIKTLFDELRKRDVAYLK